MVNIRKSVSSAFLKGESYVPRSEGEKLLIKALASIQSEEEAAHFLRDISTMAEIEEFANRITIAKMLLEKHSYVAIAEKMGTSTTTVTRVAHWLYNGCGGYYTVLNKILGKKRKPNSPQIADK